MFSSENSEKEMLLATQIMQKYQTYASLKIDNLNKNIQMMEKNLEKPYVKNKEQPYSLHAIICHDGLAENGHYYTFVYDRVQKVWFKLDDHKVFQVDESQVMEESVGNPKGYKSAFLLFYINKHIVD
jgi:ubiquitin carboxyl-terminal hydrolase 25/28